MVQQDTWELLRIPEEELEDGDPRKHQKTSLYTELYSNVRNQKNV